jgi:hypothetical protein
MRNVRAVMAEVSGTEREEKKSAIGVGAPVGCQKELIRLLK